MKIIRVTRIEITERYLRGDGRVGDVFYDIGNYKEGEIGVGFSFYHVLDGFPEPTETCKVRLADCHIDQDGTMTASITGHTHAKITQAVDYLRVYAEKIFVKF